MDNEASPSGSLDSYVVKAGTGNWLVWQGVHEMISCFFFPYFPLYVRFGMEELGRLATLSL